jgi:hypothetical protein
MPERERREREREGEEEEEEGLSGTSYEGGGRWARPRDAAKVAI